MVDRPQYWRDQPAPFDAKEAVDRQEDTNDEAWEFSRLHIQKHLGAILSPIQLQLLPYPASVLYRAKKPVHIRMYMG